MRTLTPSVILFLLLSVVQSKAAEPKRETLRARDDYIGSVSTSMAERNSDQVMQVLNSYDRYSEIYKPLIRKTSVIEQAGDTVKLNVLAVQKAFSVTAAVDTDEEIQIARPAPNRVSITANSVRIQEIANYGQPGEHAFPEDRRPGYVSRADCTTA